MRKKEKSFRKSKKRRCSWAESHELFIPYHDREWGVPVHDNRLLFEMLNLEGAQAGLSWLTILKKREGYRRAFDHFNALKISKYDARKRAALMKDEGIVRNRLKINAVIENAKAFLEVKKEFGSFDHFIWKVASIEGSAKAMSKLLKKRGFRFVGETICYAFMQAVGIVDDHSPECFKAAPSSRRSGSKN
jgi:DNA-3-methyladenine glycosylase I